MKNDVKKININQVALVAGFSDGIGLGDPTPSHAQQ